MVTATSLRRSARNSSKSSQVYRESSDSEDDYSENESASKSKKRSRKTTNKVTKSSNKKAKVKKTVDIDQLEADLEENELYIGLAQPEVDISDLAVDWIDSYVEDTSEGTNTSITSLINLILRSCGSVHLFQAHDLTNLESAAETVAELTIAFGEQPAHKYPFKTLPVFRKNILEFFEEITQVGHDKGLLYKETIDEDEEDLASPLMVQVLTWISSLSSCTIRPLRYVSTIILLSIQDQLCHIVSKVTSSLERSQNQLSHTKPSSKAKIESISRTISDYHSQKNTIIEYFNEIGNVTLGHRYRDIDPLIRVECLKYLSQAMITYPSHFFQATFLRYFGWLLSDPTNSVRVEVTKVLLKLYKHNTSNSMAIGFRQFTERYKKQIIKMMKIDSDINVRLNSISICCELNKFGFLDDVDNCEIISFLYQLIISSSTKISKANNLKLRSELAKYISIVNIQVANELSEKYSIFIKNYSSETFGEGVDQMNIFNCFKIKSLVNLLSTAKQYLENSISDEEAKQEFINGFESTDVLTTIYESLYQLPTYHNTWEFLIQYLLLDISSVKFTTEIESSESEIEEFRKQIDSSLNQNQSKEYLLSFVNGYLDHMLNNINKLKTEELSSIVLVRLTNYVPELQSLAIKSPSLLSVFLKFWNKLIYVKTESINIASIFISLDKKGIFNEINITLLDYFNSYKFEESTYGELTKEFDLYLNRLLQDYNNPVNSVNLSTSEIRLKVQTFINERLADVKEKLNFSNDSNTNDEQDDEEVRAVKENVSYLVDISDDLFKLRKFADYVNLTENFQGTDGLIDSIVFRILNSFDARPFFTNENSFHYFNVSYPKIISNFKNIFDFILICTSWKLEKLIDINEKEYQHRYDMEVEFSYLYDIIESISKGLERIGQTIKVVLEENDKFDNEKKSIDKLYALKTLFSVKLIDLLVSIKIFYIKNNQDNNFTNFNDFFTNSRELGRYVSEKIPQELQLQLVDNFLYKESKLAKLLDIDLDRDDDEDVNYSDLVSIESQSDGTEDVGQRSLFDDSESSDDDEEITNATKVQDSSTIEEDKKKNEVKKARSRARNAWKAERELCVYIVKLSSLINASIVSPSVLERLKLNSQKIGGVYDRLIKSEESDKPAEHVPVETNVADEGNDNNVPEAVTNLENESIPEVAASS
ncbi:hypothetical protein DFJ63DRAFT_332689 [Scheffersomyces coipomensis]|uniref:uncharacterized protein n=1 Tax=Scheffersomyces coipomensis TaxID=1788519 RepID=UPI00315D4344